MPVQSSTGQAHHALAAHRKHVHQGRAAAGAGAAPKGAAPAAAAAASSAGPATVVQISKAAEGALAAHEAKGDADHDGDKK